MSKAFKCVEHEEEVLEVYSFTGEEAGRRFSLLLPHVNEGIAFDSTTAPALALAILEAAVTDNSSDASEAMDLLRSHIRVEAKRTAEAEAQAKLEAEALELRNAWARGNCAQVNEFSYLTEEAQENWLAVARRAREMRDEK